MAAVTVRNISEETHRALKVRAAQNGRSTEAEIRTILEAAVQPKIGMGSALAQIGRQIGGAELDIKRDSTPTKAARFD